MELLGTTLNAGSITQIDAQSCDIPSGAVISTDPPYYDNIGYADLSDFFYVWLRQALRVRFPDRFEVLSTPKIDELVDTAFRHGNRTKADDFFLQGMRIEIAAMAKQGRKSVG